MRPSFINQDNSFFLKLSLLLSLISIVVYAIHDPVGPPSGNSWLGYTLGTLAGLIILWLLWFGVRKRRYIGQRFSLVQWLSGHVWLGTALLVLATLHCGFQFDRNMHTVFYFLMVATILSGMVGVYYYLTVPDLISRNLHHSSANQLREDIDRLDGELLSLAREIDPDVHELLLYAYSHLYTDKKLPGDRQLRALEAMAAEILARRDTVPQMNAQTRRRKTDFTGYNLRLSALVIDLAFDRSPGIKLQRLLDGINDQVDLLRKLELDRRNNRRLRFWLLFHVPLSLATVLGLVIHVVSVFYY